eukprot:TRINITY_DN1107_c0_g1_i1.p1 TRINITY_DN1107_c0_g1~~TRINITY_DN1107_c0_g1_i1.p1  ORF type:complete len:283 (+),score=96.63 TRINITY_DN1107_c0_g1_i1:372-1220(+)
MSVMFAAVAGFVLAGVVPRDCECLLPGYTLNNDQSLCTGPGGDVCVPVVSLCPNAASAAAGPTPACVGKTSFTSPGADMSTQRPSGSLGFMHTEEPLWLSLTGSQLVHVPDFMEGQPMWTADHSLPAQTTVRLVCPSSASVSGCRFYVFVYDCNTNCKPDSDLGVLATVLTPLGYHISHCAPSFKQVPTGQVHAMKAFVRVVPRGTDDTFVLPDTVRYMATSIDRFAHDCPSLSPVQCIVPGVTDCQVIGGNCVDALCPPKAIFQGPFVPFSCGTCPTQELP